MTVDVNSLFEEIGKLPQVEAIALGGSRATGRNDEKSDYDIYVYITSSIPECERRSILGKYCKYMEIGNSFWELEDDVTLKDGIDMDIIYRNIKVRNHVHRPHGLLSIFAAHHYCRVPCMQQNMHCHNRLPDH